MATKGNTNGSETEITAPDTTQSTTHGTTHGLTQGATLPTIHLILQGKGGIGKTVVATWLAEFLMGRGPLLSKTRSDFQAGGGSRASESE